MAPDHSLFVKSLVEGSGACNSGIMPGDCLMEVDGRNVYCKGTEVATKLILGPVGSVCVLKFSRIDDKSHKRIPITVNLVRELKATSTPQFNVLQKNENVKQQQVFLQCMQGDQNEGAAEQEESEEESEEEEEESEEEEEEQEEEEDNGAGVGGDAMEGVTRDDGGEEKENRRERKVLFKGKWYTEAEIEKMEKQAKAVKVEIAKMEAAKQGKGEKSEKSDSSEEEGRRKRLGRKERASSFGGALVALKGGPKRKKGQERSNSLHARTASPPAAHHSREVLGPTLFGDSPPLKRDSPHAGEDSKLAADPLSLAAAIWVVEGGTVQKEVGWPLGKKSVPLKMSTGGLLTWGKSGNPAKSGHVMWARASTKKYDPKMSKAEFADLNKRFYVMLEGEQVVAHSAMGGRVGATEAKEPLALIAGTEEERDKWVNGINMVSRGSWG